MKALFLLAAAANALAPEDATQAVDKQQKAAAISETEKSVLFIDPKHRATDYVQAFELLRKDKPSVKISLKTLGNTLIPNIAELTASSNGTLLFVKIPSNQGSKFIVIPIEEIVEIAYSPS